MTVRTTRDRMMRRHMLTACAVALAATVATGCGSSDDKADGTPSTTPQTTTATPTPDRTAEAKTEAIAAYEHMWDAAAAAFAAGKVTSPELEKNAIDKALANQEASGLYYQQHGTIMQGKPVLSPTVTSVSFATTPYTANITDCMDTTNYIEVSKTTHEPVSQSTDDRHHVATAVANFNGTSWVISDVVIDRDRTC